MKKSDFFSNVVQTEVIYNGITFKTPFFIRDAHVTGAVFICDYDKAKALVGHSHQPIRTPFNKALFSIQCIEYKETDIGPYCEVALSILLWPKGDGFRRAMESVLSLIKSNFHTYVFQLPVTTELSVAGGKGILKYPKFLADITFRDTGVHRICTLRDKNTLELILEFECPKSIRSRFPVNLIRNSMDVHTYVEGQSNKNATFKLSVPEAGQSFVWPRSGIRFGKHIISQQLKVLGIGQQVFQIEIPKCQGMLIKVDE